jgi:hypothetical protein
MAYVRGAVWERRRLRGHGHVREGVVIALRLWRGWIPPIGAWLLDSRDHRGGKQTDETFVAPKVVHVAPLSF